MFDNDNSWKNLKYSSFPSVTAILISEMEVYTVLALQRTCEV